jgi:hypothetical protein
LWCSPFVWNRPADEQPDREACLLDSTTAVIKLCRGWTIASLRAFMTLICKRGHQWRVSCEHLPPPPVPRPCGVIWEEMEILQKEMYQVLTSLSRLVLWPFWMRGCMIFSIKILGGFYRQHNNFCVTRLHLTVTCFDIRDM